MDLKVLKQALVDMGSLLRGRDHKIPNKWEVLELGLDIALCVSKEVQISQNLTLQGCDPQDTIRHLQAFHNFYKTIIKFKSGLKNKQNKTKTQTGKILISLRQDIKPAIDKLLKCISSNCM